MDTPHFIQMTKGEFARLLQALVVYDHITQRNHARGKARAELSTVQERLFQEAERFGIGTSEEQRTEIIDAAFDEIDRFVEGETWRELAWWIAERESAKRAGNCKDREATDVVTDHLYHEIMEEFQKNGIKHLAMPVPSATSLTVPHVAATLERLRNQTSSGTKV